MSERLFRDKKGTTTIETAIVTVAFLLIIFFALSSLFNVSSAIYKGCEALNKESEDFIGEDRGNVLRIALVMNKTGGEIVNAIKK